MSANAPDPDAPSGANLTERIDGSAGPMEVFHIVPQGLVTGLAVVAHGRNGAAGQPHMRRILAACRSRGLHVVTADLCNSAAGCSAGNASRFTMADHLADTIRLVEHALGKGAGPAILIGHSMGSYAVVRIAATMAQPPLAGVIAVSPVVSGTALLESRKAMGQPAVDALRAELPRAFEEWPHHDLAKLAQRVTIPAAVIVGADDTLTTPSHAAQLSALLPNVVHHEVIADEHHCPLGDAFEASVSTALSRILAAGKAQNDQVTSRL